MRIRKTENNAGEYLTNLSLKVTAPSNDDMWVLIYLCGLSLQSVGDFLRVVISARILRIREKYLVLTKNNYKKKYH